MATRKQSARSVDDYIAAFPRGVQEKLESIRRAIAKAAPGAEEKLSYGIPTFALNGRSFVFFAGFTNHVSVYPAPRTEESFKKALAPYKGGKGTVQFPLDEPVPLALVARIAKFRMRQNQGMAALRSKAKTKAKAKTKKAKVKTTRGTAAAPRRRKQ